MDSPSFWLIESYDSMASNGGGWEPVGVCATEDHARRVVAIMEASKKHNQPTCRPLPVLTPSNVLTLYYADGQWKAGA